MEREEVENMTDRAVRVSHKTSIPGLVHCQPHGENTLVVKSYCCYCCVLNFIIQAPGSLPDPLTRRLFLGSVPPSGGSEPLRTQSHTESLPHRLHIRDRMASIKMRPAPFPGLFPAPHDALGLPLGWPPFSRSTETSLSHVVDCGRVLL